MVEYRDKKMIENIFLTNENFVKMDNRSLRGTNPVTSKTLYDRFCIMANPNMIKGKTVLDLGCCIGAMGYWCEHFGASKYVGIEIQKDYYNIMVDLFKESSICTPILDDIENFLDANTDQFDIIILSGVLYAFVDYYGLLSKISKTSKEYIVIETNSPMSKNSQIEYNRTVINSSKNGSYVSKGANISKETLEFLLFTLNFKPLSINTISLNYLPFFSSGQRYISIFKKTDTTNFISIKEKLKNEQPIDIRWIPHTGGIHGNYNLNITNKQV